ncbi:DUF4437 domain-containing protein [Aquimarina sp. 2304DJ70-9]|uniref:DUF4437 domain-containing protein n=1 Tax=Aquimarina penaris TaxID=3231044 RepID=UPI0034628FC0
MNNLKNILIVSVLILSTLYSCGQDPKPNTTVQSLNTDGKAGIFLTPEDLKWVTAFDGFPINFAMVSGNTFEGSHGTFAKFPGGSFITPPHTHANSYKAVVISGQIINPMEDEEPEDAKVMGPGSYWYVPANEVHTTGCVSEEPCIFYMYQSVPFNFEPVTTNK